MTTAGRRLIAAAKEAREIAQGRDDQIQRQAAKISQLQGEIQQLKGKLAQAKAHCRQQQIIIDRQNERLQRSEANRVFGNGKGAQEAS